MSNDKVITKSADISADFDQIASQIFATAKRLYADNHISYQQYNDIYKNYYVPIIGYSARIVIDQSIAQADQLDTLLTDIRSGITEINASIHKIERAEDIFKVFAALIATTASIATCATTQNPAAFLAAVESLKNLVAAINSTTD